MVWFAILLNDRLDRESAYGVHPIEGRHETKLSEALLNLCVRRESLCFASIWPPMGSLDGVAKPTGACAVGFYYFR